MSEPLIKSDLLLDAVADGGRTMLGGDFESFPVEHGNCFSLSTADEQSWRIVNFVAENLDEAFERGLLDWPVKILPLAGIVWGHSDPLGKLHAYHAGAGHRAVICDARIPQTWYARRICPICCPAEWLPWPQRLQLFLMEQRGSRKVTHNAIGNGVDVVMTDGSHEPESLNPLWNLKTVSPPTHGQS